MKKDLTHLSLFTGIGGIDLAAEQAGFHTAGQCEWADYPTKVLEKHWPDVPRWRDIHELTAANFFERTGLRTVDLISGGFPCQPWSCAGKQFGERDDRDLWPEMFRVIQELRPTWVLGENVARFARLGLDRTISNLEAEGYAVRVFIFPAASVGAKHERMRTFIVAYADSNARNERRAEPAGQQRQAGVAGGGDDVANAMREGRDRRQGGKESLYEQQWNAARCEQQRRGGFAGASEGSSTVADSKRIGSRAPCDQPRCNQERHNQTPEQARQSELRTAGCCGSSVPDTDNPRFQVPGHESELEALHEENGIELGDWWAVEPGMGRVAHGVPSRVDRLKCLGNAVVPQQVYPVLAAIMAAERGTAA